MSSEIQEGFLCPVCVIDLKDPTKLKSHFKKLHTGHEIRINPKITNKYRIQKFEIGEPQTFEHKFGVTKIEGENVFADPYLTKKLLEYAGLEEDVLQSPGQKEEIEKFCRESDVLSRLKRYLTLSENPDWQMSIPSFRSYVDEEDTNKKDSRISTRSNSELELLSHHLRKSEEKISQTKRKTLIEVKGKPPLPPKPNPSVIDKNASRTRNVIVPSKRLIKIRKKPKDSSKPNTVPTKTYGTNNQPIAPPLPSCLLQDKNTPLGQDKLKIGTAPKEQSLKVNSQNGITCQKEINSTSSNKNDIRSALLGALDRIKKDVRSSEYYLCETDSSSDDEWMD